MGKLPLAAALALTFATPGWSLAAGRDWSKHQIEQSVMALCLAKGVPPDNAPDILSSNAANPFPALKKIGSSKGAIDLTAFATGHPAAPRLTIASTGSLAIGIEVTLRPGSFDRVRAVVEPMLEGKFQSDEDGRVLTSLYESAWGSGMVTLVREPAELLKCTIPPDALPSAAPLLRAASTTRFEDLAAKLALASPPGAHADKLDEAAVRALVARWLAAQNKGDFAAYRALYAVSFHGVRRSGGRTAIFDYDGWLHDRERMFKKPMKVAATDLQVTPMDRLAQVTFVQEFSSGTYADRGRKRLDVAVIGGALTIAREELLESERLPVKAKPADAGADAKARAAREPRQDDPCPAPKAAPFSGTFHGEPGWLVLGDTSADEDAITTRALQLESDGVEAHPIATDLFEGLKRGLYAVVHGAFATREEAETLAAALRARKLKTYVKQSGPLRGGGRLIEIRGVATWNGTPGSYPLEVRQPRSPTRALTTETNGQFVMWTDLVGEIELENQAPGSRKDNSRATGQACVRVEASTRGRVDVGTLETSSWFCPY
jgi:ketosteroid isomerase-like protein